MDWESDIAKKYIAKSAKTSQKVASTPPQNSKSYKQQPVDGEPEGTDEEPELPQATLNRMIKPGLQVNLLTVIGPYKKTGKYGTFSNREYTVRCQCGRIVRATYAQVYQKSLYSCGCTPRPKHPPIRLEGKVIGDFDVIQWVEDEGFDEQGQVRGAWESVCKTCGAIKYFRTVSELRVPCDHRPQKRKVKQAGV